MAPSPLAPTLDKTPSPLTGVAAFHHATALWLRPGDGPCVLQPYGPSAVQYLEEPDASGGKPRATNFSFPLVLPAPGHRRRPS